MRAGIVHAGLKRVRRRRRMERHGVSGRRTPSCGAWTRRRHLREESGWRLAGCLASPELKSPEGQTAAGPKPPLWPEADGDRQPSGSRLCNVLARPNPHFGCTFRARRPAHAVVRQIPGPRQMVRTVRRAPSPRGSCHPNMHCAACLPAWGSAASRNTSLDLLQLKSLRLPTLEEPGAPPVALLYHFLHTSSNLLA